MKAKEAAESMYPSTMINTGGIAKRIESSPTTSSATGAATDGVTYPLHCVECDVTSNSAAAAEMHAKGRKHMNKMAAKAQVGRRR